MQAIKSVTTIDQAIDGTQLIKFVRGIGQMEAEMVIADLIASQASKWNLPNTITTEQAYDTACMIIQDNPYLTVEDIVIMFREALMQKDGYDKIYGRLDASLIFAWLNNYIERKLDRQDAIREQKKRDEQNALHDVGRTITSNLAEPLTMLLNRVQQKHAPLPSSGMTMEKHIRYVRENMHCFSEKELDGLKLRFNAHNLFGVYKDLVNELNAEIEKRAAQATAKKDRANSISDNSGSGSRSTHESAV